MSTLDTRSHLAHANSFLFVPGTQPARVPKALASGADFVILDLEDAVAPGDKDRARQAVEHSVLALPQAQRAQLLVRINAAGTAWFEADLALLARLVPQGLAGVVIPKAEMPETLQTVARHGGPQALLLPLVESVAGMDALNALCQAPQVVRLAFGHLDFQVDAGMQCGADEIELLPTRMALVMAARRHGLAAPIDGVTVNTQDMAQVDSDTARAVRMGFGAKLCIHPAQIATVNRVCAPTAAAVAHAQAVLQAMEAAQGGVCVVNGKMVDAPVLQLAQQTLQRHRFAQQRSDTTQG